MTAASMNNAALHTVSYDDFSVTAIVTAGVRSNGGRIGDPASWHEKAENDFHTTPGTINILLYVEAFLSAEALAQALMSCTEAKTAALQELLIPSRYSSVDWPRVPVPMASSLLRILRLPSILPMPANTVNSANASAKQSSQRSRSLYILSRVLTANISMIFFIAWTDLELLRTLYGKPIAPPVQSPYPAPNLPTVWTA